MLESDPFQRLAFAFETLFYAEMRTTRQAIDLVIIVRRRVVVTFALVHFAMSS